MSRRIITILAFAIALVLTVIGSHYCNQKIVPAVRLALWFPLPYWLNVYEIPGILLAWLQFPLLAGGFALAIRRWRARWVLAVMVIIYGLYVAAVIVKLGPVR